MCGEGGKGHVGSLKNSDFYSKMRTKSMEMGRGWHHDPRCSDNKLRRVWAGKGARDESGTIFLTRDFSDLEQGTGEGKEVRLWKDREQVLNGFSRVQKERNEREERKVKRKN